MGNLLFVWLHQFSSVQEGVNMTLFYKLIMAFVASFITAFITTPFVKKIALRIKAVDKPDSRKIHKYSMPRMGGLSIIAGFIAGLLILKPGSVFLPSVLLGALVIVFTGILDDKYNLSPFAKLVGQIIAAIIVVSSGLTIGKITLPFAGPIYLGLLDYPVTIFWIVGITNAINLIDGLDGLAAGVSTIALSSILVMAVLHNQTVVVMLCVIIIGSVLGFLPFNFYPAKIFMGDTGALFLGYMISIVSMLGLFKNIALFSFVIPVIILAIPIFDTFFAIIRRIVNGQKITSPDKQHLHYRLLEMGFSHRATVLIIYGISMCFGVAAIIFSEGTLWTSLIIIVLTLLIVQIGAEVVGLIGKNKKPIINTMKRIFAGKRVVKEDKS